MGVIYVGVGEIKASKSPGDIIKTMALGSCVAVIVLDPKNRAIGMLHAALPDSSINRRRATEKPGMFMDSGIPVLLRAMQELGFDDSSRLIIKLVGGASIMDPNQTFNIGKRNVLAARRVLWSLKLGPLAEDVGDSFSRTVTADVDTGRTTISSPGKGEWNL